MNKQNSRHRVGVFSSRTNSCRKSVKQRTQLVSIIGTLAMAAFSVVDAGAQEPRQQVRFLPDVVSKPA